MKILFAAVIFLSASAQAAVPLADCWTVDGSSPGHNAAGELISDGQWIVSADPALISKDELIWLLHTTNRQSLQQFMTIVRPEYIYVAAKAVDDGSHYPKLSPREEIQRKANEQMRAIAALPAITAMGCNTISPPSASRAK